MANLTPEALTAEMDSLLQLNKSVLEKQNSQYLRLYSQSMNIIDELRGQRDTLKAENHALANKVRLMVMQFRNLTRIFGDYITSVEEAELVNGPEAGERCQSAASSRTNASSVLDTLEGIRSAVDQFNALCRTSEEKLSAFGGV